jgi:hypothetical protein
LSRGDGEVAPPDAGGVEDGVADASGLSLRPWANSTFSKRAVTVVYAWREGALRWV